MEFKLNPYIRITYFLNAVALNEKGQRERVRYPFEPNQVYNTDDFINKTPNIIDLVEHTISFIPYSTSIVKELQAMNASYTTEGCKSCGGKITQIKLQVFEVI